MLATFIWFARAVHDEQPAERAGVHGLPRPDAWRPRSAACAAPTAGLILVVAYILLHYLFVSQTAHLLALFGVFLDVGVKLGVNRSVPWRSSCCSRRTIFSAITPQGSSANLLFAERLPVAGRSVPAGRAHDGVNLRDLSRDRHAMASARRVERGPMDYVRRHALRENPELAIFLTLALGFVIGRLRVGSFSLGNVVGTLLAGVLVGQLDIRSTRSSRSSSSTCSCSPPATRSGPQFFRGLGEARSPQVAAHGRALRHQPRRPRSLPPASSATTAARRRASWPAPSPSPRSSAPRATRSRGSTCRTPRRRGC